MTDRDRTRAAADPGFRAFAATTFTPQLDSWRVDDRLDVPGGSIEFWAAPVAPGLIQYVHLAAAKDPAGEIMAIAAVETMPAVHDSVYLGLFVRSPEAHENFGEAPGLVDVQEFLTAAKPLLASALAAHDAPTDD